MTSTEIQHDLDRLQSQLVGAKDARRKLQRLLETAQENVTAAESALAQICTDRATLVRRAVLSGALDALDDAQTVAKARDAADLLAHRRDMIVDIERELSAVDKDMVALRREIEHTRALLGKAIFTESIIEIRPVIPLMQKSLQGWCSFADRSADDHLARGCWLTELFTHENDTEQTATEPTAA